MDSFFVFTRRQQEKLHEGSCCVPLGRRAAVRQCNATLRPNSLRLSLTRLEKEEERKKKVADRLPANGATSGSPALTVTPREIIQHRAAAELIFKSDVFLGNYFLLSA